MKKALWACSAILLSAILGDCCAQAQTELTDEERQAMAAINQRSVTAAVSFLASDELGGRGTPSPGLKVAGAYVAARFRAAGLTGGGDDGSLYQKASMDQLQTPTAGVELINAAGDTITNYGLLSGGPTPVDCRGTVTAIDFGTQYGAQELVGPVAANYSASSSARRALHSIARKTQSLQKAGASALILKVDPSHALIEQAKQNQQSPRPASSRLSFATPVLLVPNDIDLDGEMVLRCPAEQRIHEPVVNVVGVLPGIDQELSNQAIVFSAHLDHLGERPNGTDDRIYNGADDNASGVTAVVSLADAYGALQTPPKRTTIFIAFWGEERGLLGSRYLVQNPVWPLDQIVANINIEMIGRPEPGANQKIWMTGWEQSNLGALMAQGARRVEVEIFEHPQYSAMLYRNSDNWPFAQAGVIAHSFSAGSLHRDYHQPSDEWERLNLTHMTEVIRGLFAGSLPIADGELNPEKSETRR